MSDFRWMLPEGVEEALPERAWALEALRRRLLDHYRACGYALVHTPLVEHLDSLLTGSAADLERQTFKLVDPASGRLLGLRADMTPQAARIAARHFADVPVVRLCYLGTVLRAQAGEVGGSRSPRQVGCELFGVPGLDGDLEVLERLLETLALAGIAEAHLDLGHVGLYRALVAGLALNAADEATLFDLLQRKSRPDFEAWAGAVGLPAAARERLRELMALNGDVSVLSRARSTLAASGEGVAEALSHLEAVAERLTARHPGLKLHVDLAELRGYRYKTGLVFAAFVPGHGREIARGGRYDGVGAAFGEARPATGFSADVNELLQLGAAE